MNDRHDLELVLRSHVPIVVLETHDESRVLDQFRQLAVRLGKPVLAWTVTTGLRRIDLDIEVASPASEPSALLEQVRATETPGIYLLLDFHPYLDDPVHVRLLKEIALRSDPGGHTLVLVSHALDLPPELRGFTARVEMALPDAKALEELIREEAKAWSGANGGRRVATDNRTLEMLIRHLGGLTVADARRLVRHAIQEDGAITQEDLPQVMQAKYRLLDRGGVLSFEFDTARLADVGGLTRLKRWLQQRQTSFLERESGLEPPRGILLVGVQGAGKSLAAKAVAGLWGLPLLRLDFGTLYNKFHGETERNLRESLAAAEAMAPCVLWVDEVEKGVAADQHDGGTSQRVLGTLLTWMAERKAPVFLVATANVIERLPPELIRKGRLDEIFFVDLPDTRVREEIFAIHLRKREQDPAAFDLPALAAAAEQFSGAEIEQVVVAALYLAREQRAPLETRHLLTELGQTRPLARVMVEKISALRNWARERTVPANGD